MAKILVVDDSRLTRRLITNALSGAGHEVVQAGNGQEGLKAFRAFDPDCVMTDLLMPVMDGFEFAQQIREIDPTRPILVSSADIQERSRLRCEEIGVNRMLNKPLRNTEIVAAVDEALTAHEAPTS